MSVIKYYRIEDPEIYFMDYIANNDPVYETYLKPENYQSLADLIIMMLSDFEYPENSEERQVLQIGGDYYHNSANCYYEILDLISDNKELLQKMKDYITHDYDFSPTVKTVLDSIDCYIEQI